MITAFNTALIGVGYLPMCAVCSDLTRVATCGCTPRQRGVKTVQDGDDVLVYDGGDAAAARCLSCVGPQWCGDQPTPKDARYRVFVSSGDVYARIVNGRKGQRVVLEVEVSRSAAARDLYKTVEFFI